MNFIIYTDGGSRGNPGPAGAGVVISDEYGNVLKKASEYLGEQTNNFAEYSAVILALQTLRRVVKKKDRKDVKIEIKMDSQLVAKQLSGKYKIEEESLFPLFIKIHNLQIEHFPKLSFTYIPREKNKEADALANEAMDSQAKQGTLLE